MIALVEHGESGSGAAAPVVRKLLSYYIDNIYKPKSQNTVQTNLNSENIKFSTRLQMAFN